MESFSFPNHKGEVSGCTGNNVTLSKCNKARATRIPQNSGYKPPPSTWKKKIYPAISAPPMDIILPLLDDSTQTGLNVALIRLFNLKTYFDQHCDGSF